MRMPTCLTHSRPHQFPPIVPHSPMHFIHSRVPTHRLTGIPSSSSSPRRLAARGLELEEMAKKVKALAIELNGLSLSPRTHEVEGRGPLNYTLMPLKSPS